MTLVVLLGVIGNFLLAVTIIKCPRLRTKSINIFIANLSISNIINLIVVAPLVTLDNLSEFFVLGNIGCKLKLVSEYLFFIVPMLSILVISIDRSEQQVDGKLFTVYCYLVDSWPSGSPSET